MPILPIAVKALNAILPEDSWSWVFPALRQDQLVWDSLQNLDFATQAIQKIGVESKDWSPANLSLIALDYAGSIGQALEDAELLERAEKSIPSFPGWVYEPNEATSLLAQAGLLALAQFNNAKETGSWIDSTKEIPSCPNILRKSVFACLYGLVSDPFPLLHSVAISNNSLPHLNLMLHAILSNPQPPQEGFEFLTKVLNTLSLHGGTILLRDLHLQRPGIATRLAKVYLTTRAFPQNGRAFTHITEQMDFLSDLLLHAEINSIAGLASETVSLRTEALQSIHQLRSEIAAQLAGAAVEDGDIENALTTWQRGGERRSSTRKSRTSPPPPEFTIALIDAGHPEDALALIPEEDMQDLDKSHPSHLIATARLSADQGNMGQAQIFAKQALQNFLDLTAAGEMEDIGTVTRPRSFSPTSRALVVLLSELKLQPEAAIAAEIALSFQPNDIDILNRYTYAQRAAGDPGGAAITAYQTVSLAPGKIKPRRELITCLEEAEDWEAALDERTKLLDKRFAPSPESSWPTKVDQIGLATASLKTNQPERTVEICEKLLCIDEQDGIIHALLGEANLALGDTEQAFENLDLATQLSPHQASPWLALASVQESVGNQEKALETLRSASHAVPSDPRTQLALAENYLSRDEFTQALPVLLKAHELISNIPTHSKSASDHQDPTVSSQLIPRISLRLGETLQKLGHLDESRTVLEETYNKYPAYEGLAYQYAKSLLSLNDYAASIPPLVVAVQAAPEELGPNFDYGRALLANKTQPSEAVRVLRKSHEIARSDPYILALLAEALSANGEKESAMQKYSQIMESPLMDDPKWKSRISHGFGRTALALEKPEIAIASLQEAAQVDTQNPSIFQTLAEAYLATELTKEALEASHTAMQLAPDEIEMLMWFANIALEAGEPANAIPALSRALQLSPQHATILIQIGYIYALIGDQDAAADSYRQILSTENPHPYELLNAAEGLNLLGDYASAIACLERGLDRLAEPDSEYFRQMALAYKNSDQYERAIETLDRAILLEPASTDLLVEKTDLLILLDRPQAAEASLEHAINLNPDNPALHHRMALFLRSSGRITDALSKSEELLSLHYDDPRTTEAYTARAFAAELARALLQHEYAKKLLADQTSLERIPADHDARERSHEIIDAPITSEAVHYYCLLAEFALENDEEVAAAGYLTNAYELAPDHPRVLALQSRLTLRRGDQRLADQTLQSALAAVGLSEEPITASNYATELKNLPSSDNVVKFHEQLCNFYSLAEAALEINHWMEAIEILKQIVSLAPNEPFTHLSLARALVLRAEYQDFCHSLEVINHAPGQHVLSESVYRSFKDAIDFTELSFAVANRERSFDETLLIQRWKVRGDAIFDPDPKHTRDFENLPHKSSDHAAQIAAASKMQDLAEITKIYKTIARNSGKDSLPHHDLPPLARSLSIRGRRQEDYEKAKTAIQAAIKQKPNQPLYYALLARVAHFDGDNGVASKAIQNALTTWPDEPRWHAKAAEIILSEGNNLTAIEHLKQATVLEPDRLSHHLLLGECLQLSGNFQAAIQTFECAQEIAPDNVDPYLRLAKAYLFIGEVEKAAFYSQTAIKKAPDKIPPWLVGAEVSLQDGNISTAQKYIKSALKIDPYNPDALCIYARVLEETGRTDEALETLDKAINIAVDPLPLMLERADLIASTRGAKAALTIFQELASDFPDEPAALSSLAKALASAGNKDDAILAAQSALRCDTSHITPKELSNIHYLLGHLLRQAGQLDQSTHQLNESIRLTPKFLDPYLELGRALQERRQHALSLQAYQKAITIDPEDPRPYCQAGLLLKESRDYQGAESMLRRAADLAPDDLSIHRQLGALVALNIVHNRRAIRKA